MDLDLMAVLNKAAPQSDIEFFRLQNLAMSFICYRQLEGDLDAANIPKFHVGCGFEDISLILNQFVFSVTLLEYNIKVSGNTCFLLGPFPVTENHDFT